MRLSIRWRLTLWNTLALAVVLLGFAALVYTLLAGALYEQIDHKLLAEMALEDVGRDAPGDVGRTARRERHDHCHAARRIGLRLCTIHRGERDNRRLAEVEAIVIENNVTDFVLAKAQVKDKAVSFDELMGQQ